jgi:YegS/Rv2252/BmrU family lipid kinase
MTDPAHYSAACLSNRDRALVIANPRSGGGRAGRAIDEVRVALERRLGAVDFAITERSTHAVELAREAVRRGRTLVVAVGGDGTLHEVANGVLDAGGGAAVGYVGQGTGGDFRRTLGVEHRLEAYVDAIASGRLRRIDAGRCRFRSADGVTQERWFVNVLSVGLGGLVDRYVSETTKVLGGNAAYFWASVRAIARCPRGHIRCDVALGIDRRTRQLETFMLAICNGSYFGSGMHVAPMARPDDGRFEVVSLGARNKLSFALSSSRIYTGKHLSNPGVEHFACDRLAVDIENEEARSQFSLDVDGEPLGVLPLEVDVVPQALMLRV